VIDDLVRIDEDVARAAADPDRIAEFEELLLGQRGAGEGKQKRGNRAAEGAGHLSCPILVGPKLPSHGKRMANPGPTLASAPGPQPVDEELLEIARRVLEATFAAAIRPEHRTHLYVEVRIVLGGGPDREDQMVGVGAREAAGLHPALDHPCLLVHQRLQLALQHRHDARRALQDLVGEEPALAREIARHLQLAAAVGPQFPERVTFGIEFAQRREPCVQQPLDQGLVDGVLGAEIVEQVWLRHAGGLRDLVDRRAAEAMRGKHFKGCFENALALFGLEARAARLGRRVQPQNPGKRPVWTKGLDQLFRNPGAPTGLGNSPTMPLTAPMGVLTFVQSVKNDAYHEYARKTKRWPSTGNTKIRKGLVHVQ